MLIRITISSVFILSVLLVKAQDSLLQIRPGYLDRVSAKAGCIDQQLDKQSDKLIRRMVKLERKLEIKLAKADSLKAKEIFGNAGQKYKELQQRLQTSLLSKHYIPSLDTLTTSLKFLAQNRQLLSPIKEGEQKLKNALSKVNSLKYQFEKGEEIRQFIKERKQFLKEQLGQSGFARELKKINKQVYYYSERINEYKAMLNDHKKAERKAIDLLSKTKLFRDFMRKNSMLTSLFRLPGDINDPLPEVSLMGLQTRAQVNNVIQQQIAAGGPNAATQFSRNLQDAQSKMSDLKNKVSKFRGINSDMEMPEGFKPNPDKTKTFLQRIQFNADFQTTRHNKLFPLNSDLGLSAAYRINRNSMIAIGSSFKLGWGTGFDHIRISSQGFSLRGGMDWRLRGDLFIAGSYEQNYFSAIRDIIQLRDKSSWKTAALLGLRKRYTINKGKGGEIKLLYDFLYNRPPVKTQPLTIRFGYNLK